jgi:hypothetical protein
MPLTHVMLAALLNVRSASITRSLKVLERGNDLGKASRLIAQTLSDYRSWAATCFGLIEREYRPHLLLAVDAEPKEDAEARVARRRPISLVRELSRRSS